MKLVFPADDAEPIHFTPDPLWLIFPKTKPHHLVSYAVPGFEGIYICSDRISGEQENASMRRFSTNIKFTGKVVLFRLNGTIENDDVWLLDMLLYNARFIDPKVIIVQENCAVMNL